MRRCRNKEINAQIFESHIFKAIEDTMLKPSKLKLCMDFLQNDTQSKQKKFERQLRYIDEKLKVLTAKKRRLVDIYASGEVEKEQYVAKNLEYDNEINALKMQRSETASLIPLLYKIESVNLSVAQYCESARAQYDQANNFDTKRKFLVDHVKRVVFKDNSYVIHGLVPITSERSEDSIEFKIKGVIPKVMK